MRAAEYVEPGRLRLIDTPEPVVGGEQAVIEVAVCGICGSDLHALVHGLAVRPGQVLGHEFSGLVAEADPATGLHIGDRVCVRPLIPCRSCPRCLAGEPQQCERGYRDQIGFAMPGAFAERVLVPRASLGETVFRLPDSVDDESGALVEPLAVGLHAIRLGRPELDETAVVFGLGAIGLATVAFLHLVGLRRVVAFDPSHLRRDAAASLGADHVFDPVADGPIETMRALSGTGPMGAARADLAFDCAGADGVLADAIGVVRTGGRIVLTGLADQPRSLDVTRVVQKELTIRGALGYADEFSSVIEMLAEGTIDGSALISHRFGLEEIEEAFAVQRDAERSLKVTVSPTTGGRGLAIDSDSD